MKELRGRWRNGEGLILTHLVVYWCGGIKRILQIREDFMRILKWDLKVGIFSFSVLTTTSRKVIPDLRMCIRYKEDKSSENFIHLCSTSRVRWSYIVHVRRRGIFCGWRGRMEAQRVLVDNAWKRILKIRDEVTRAEECNPHLLLVVIILTSSSGLNEV